MNIPCPSTINCGCGDNPLTNFSSEMPDERIYRALSWLQVQPRIGRVPRLPPRRPPNICADRTSRLYALFCADRISIITTNLENDNWDGTGNPPQLYSNLPANCTVNCPDGNVFAYQVGAGTFVGQDFATVNAQAAALACQLAVGRKICLGDLPPVVCADQPYDEDLVATSVAPVVSMAVVSGSLPPGLSLMPRNAYIWRLVGIPSTAGDYTFTIRATNSLGNYMEKLFTLTVIQISPDVLPTAYYQVAYYAALTAIGGVPPYTFTVAGPPAQLPPDGITIHPDGTIDGAPTEAGTFNFVVVVTDSAGNTCQNGIRLRVVGVCNTELVYTTNCPGTPSIITTVTIPAETYCEAPGTSQGEVDGQAAEAAQNQIADYMAANGCSCYYRVNRANGSIRTFGCSVSFTVRTYPGDAIPSGLGGGYDTFVVAPAMGWFNYWNYFHYVLGLSGFPAGYYYVGPASPPWGPRQIFNFHP